VFAAHLGIDFDSLGITIVPVGGNSFGLFAKLLGSDGLGISHELVCDRDAAKSVVRQAMSAGVLPTATFTDVNEVRAQAAAVGIHWWSAGTLEDTLLSAGAAPLYVQAFEEQVGPAYLRRVAESKGEPLDRIAERDSLAGVIRNGKGSKPHLAQRVAELFGESRLSIPDEIERALRRVAASAEREARATGGEAPAAD
jgi:predicted ATP-dependent endonuclease of OLD family